MTGGYLERPEPSGLADVIELILDKGIVIDAYVRVSLLGIELLTIDARIVISSVDTYLRFAEATNRLDLYAQGGKGLSEVVEDLGGPVIDECRQQRRREQGHRCHREGFRRRGKHRREGCRDCGRHRRQGSRLRDPGP